MIGVIFCPSVSAVQTEENLNKWNVCFIYGADFYNNISMAEYYTCFNDCVAQSESCCGGDEVCFFNTVPACVENYCAGLPIDCDEYPDACQTDEETEEDDDSGDSNDVDGGSGDIDKTVPRPLGIIPEKEAGGTPRWCGWIEWSDIDDQTNIVTTHAAYVCY